MSEGRVVLELVRIATQCGLRTAPELSLLGKTLLNLDTVCHALAPGLDTQRLVEDQLQHVMRARLRKSLSSPNLASEMMEVQALLRDGPRTLWVGVWSENFGAQRFYARYGFDKAGEYLFPVGATRDHEFIFRRQA